MHIDRNKGNLENKKPNNKDGCEKCDDCNEIIENFKRCKKECEDYYKEKCNKWLDYYNKKYIECCDQKCKDYYKKKSEECIDYYKKKIDSCCEKCRCKKCCIGPTGPTGPTGATGASIYTQLCL